MTSGMTVKAVSWVIGAALLAGGIGPQAAAAELPAEGLFIDGFHHDLSLLLGLRNLPEKLDDNGGKDLALGMALDYRVRGIEWPLGFAVQLAALGADGNTTDALWTEVSVGGFVPFEFENLRIDAGGGVQMFHVEVDPAVGKRECLIGAGAYAEVGARYSLNEWFDLTAMFRYSLNSDEDSRVLGDDVNLNSWTFYTGVGFLF